MIYILDSRIKTVFAVLFFGNTDMYNIKRGCYENEYGNK